MKINPCSCGATPEFIKLFSTKRYDGFIRCPKCGYEGRTYASKQGAVIAWNKTCPNNLPENNETSE